MIAPILAPWQDAPPLWIDGGDARRPVYRLVPPRPPPSYAFQPHVPNDPITLELETIDAHGHRYIHAALRFDGIVYGDEDRVLHLLTLAAEAILFVAWCCSKVTPNAMPAPSRS